MTVYKIDSSNVATAVDQLKIGNQYFVITVDVKFTKADVPPTDNEKDKDKIPLGANSVLDFKGGSFSGASESLKVDLNSCQIVADPYPIFKDNIEILGLSVPEVKAEWFKLSKDSSDADCVNRALIAAEGCPVVLEPKTYTLKSSIKFPKNGGLRQTLICPGTLLISPSNPTADLPAIDVNTGIVSLKINKITGVETSTRNYGIGILFSVYTEHSDIEVNTMNKLRKGFCILPNVLGTHPSKPAKDIGGLQYCRFKFGSISADYCFYIDVFSKAQYVIPDTENVITLTDIINLSEAKITPLNWFNENQIYGELMQGKYGIYIVDSNEFDIENRTVGKGCSNTFNPDNISNAMNGLLFENISFEKITVLPIRLRSVNRSCFYNLQMFNSLPGDNPVGDKDFTPWIDLAYIKEVRMSFNSFVVPTHIKVGDYCRNSYINGAILDKPSQYTSHFDTLGIDQIGEVYQMFVTNSVVPFNMTKQITVTSDTTMYLKDLMPTLNEGASTANQSALRVLPSNIDVDIRNDKQLIIDLTGMNNFAPCLYTINAKISKNGTLIFRTTDYLEIDEGAPASGSTSSKAFTEGGVYALQWLSNWKIQIKKIANLS